MNRSLRGRLGLAVALGSFLLALVAAVLVGFERWQEEMSSLPLTVELDAFRLSEVESVDGFEQDVTVGDSGFALLLDEVAAVVVEAGEIDTAGRDVAVEVWSNTTEQDVVFSTVLDDDDGPELYVSGVACVNQQVCDSAIVGRVADTLPGYLLARIPWLLGPALLVSAAALAVARWMVGQALRPVEAMRAEVAVITGSELDRRVPLPGTGDEIERLGLTLNDTLGRLQASSEATERFAADAAHELRSPITGARAAVELRAADDELLTDAVFELDRAGRLIDDLLVLARRQSGPRPRQEVDLDDIIVRDIGAAKIRFPDAVLEMDVQPARVLGDPDGLRRVVSNLIENAAAYCEGRVLVSLAASAGGWRLQVDDDGPGIAEAERTRIFERFARLDESRARATGGSGLGLALVAELVADHGGTVSVDDAPMGGARFEVYLPEATAP